MHNPANGMRNPDRRTRMARQYLFPSEFLMFIAYERVPIRGRRAVTVAIDTYMRVGELRALTWDDVDIEHGCASVAKSAEPSPAGSSRPSRRAR